ncbi:hypothetical protein CDL12_21093 [Handroanthus impetiginosus]|uniref:Ubiquitinyl hydrolase 1 n=1 Tax=Handroanthus impetiginosus TaxID=429701 RepID=A0A2G9GM24_9LAMI|nr:hypothetical protein CDL12_21093 [Handroanthus impetiginosus]
MGHCCILIPRPRDEEVCRGRRKSEEIPQRLYIWLYWWEECKLPNKLHDAEDCLKSITDEMELCLLNSDITVAVIVRAKDQEIRELKKRVAELEAAANKDLCVLPPVKADTTVTKEQGDHGEACEEKDEEKEDEEDEEMDKERKNDENKEEKEKVEEDEQKEGKIEEGQDDKKGEKEDGENEEGKEKESEKEEERKDGDDDEEPSIMPHEVEMNKKLEMISRKLDFGQDVNFGEQDYEAVHILNEKRDHAQEKKTIPEQEKINSQQKKMVRLEIEMKAFEK